jgi:cytochrome c-type biogenesis protein CcmE
MLGVGLLLLGLGIAAALTLTAFRKNLMNFYTPSDLSAGVAANGERLRLGGLVLRGSLKRLDGLKIEFTIADCTQSLPVRYEGILPDLFREGQGVVATGSMNAERMFIADEILAKHDENYVPPQVAQSLKTAAGHACEPFKPVGKE